MSLGYYVRLNSGCVRMRTHVRTYVRTHMRTVRTHSVRTVRIVRTHMRTHAYTHVRKICVRIRTHAYARTYARAYRAYACLRTRWFTVEPKEKTYKSLNFYQNFLLQQFFF